MDNRLERGENNNIPLRPDERRGIYNVTFRALDFTGPGAPYLSAVSLYREYELFVKQLKTVKSTTTSGTHQHSLLNGCYHTLLTGFCQLAIRSQYVRITEANVRCRHLFLPLSSGIVYIQLTEKGD